MGDKDPKSAHKQSRQKSTRAAQEQQTKDAAQAAKQVAKPGAPTPDAGSQGKR